MGGAELRSGGLVIGFSRFEVVRLRFKDYELMDS
jgi:hypothetical protein